MYTWPQNQEIQPTNAELKAVLGDDLKVLKSLGDYARKAFVEYTSVVDRDLGKMEFHIRDAARTVNHWLIRGDNMIGNIMHEAYGGSEKKDFEGPWKQAYLREAKRLVNLAARVAARFLGDVLKVKPYYRMEMAEETRRLIAVFCGTMSPNGGPFLYRNPDAIRWLDLDSRALRRIADAWLEKARAGDERARLLKPIKMPAKLEGITWPQLERFGFVLVAGQDVTKQEVVQAYLPVAWSLDRSSDSNEVRLRDRSNRHRVSMFAAADGNSPVMRVIPRYRVIEVQGTGENAGKVAYYYYDGYDGGHWTSCTTAFRPAPNAEGRAQIEKALEPKLNEKSSYNVVAGWPDHS